MRKKYTPFASPYRIISPVTQFTLMTMIRTIVSFFIVFFDMCGIILIGNYY
jgi:hypothetical protein